MTNKDNCVYGVDTTKKVTPLMVRDAIIECFVQAHDDVLKQMIDMLNIEKKQDINDFKYENVVTLIQTMFDEIDGDFDNPTKESLIELVYNLKKFAALYRDRKTIEKHANEIMQLVDKI